MQLTSLELAVRPEAPAIFEAVIPDSRIVGLDRSLFVFIESLDDSDARIEVDRPEDFVPEIETSRPDRARIFAGRLTAGAKAITLRISSPVTRRIRIFFGWAAKRIASLLDKLPCEGCVMAIRAAIKAGLAFAGVPFLDGQDLEITAEIVAKIISAPALDEVAEFLERLFGKGGIWIWIWERLWDLTAGAADSLGQALKLADQTYRRICNWLGLCPPSHGYLFEPQSL